MKRRQFLQHTSLGAAAVTLPFGAKAIMNQSAADEKEYYELRVYTLKFGGNRGALNTYLEEGLIPALNRNGVNRVGVFEELGQATPTKIYLLIPYPSMEVFLTMPQQLAANRGFSKAQNEYDKLPPEQQVYNRYDTWLLEAFDALPQMKFPEQEDSLFELRTYEGYSEDAVRRKVKMFNEEELPVFYNTGLNPVFFGKMLVGPDMPALTYMLHFKDMEERDANWEKFRVDPDWKRMSQLPEYANTVSNINRVFLKPLGYSQV